MANLINSSKILSYHTMFIVPQMVFTTPLYIEYKGALRQCKVKRLETIVQDSTAPYLQHVVADVANVGIVKFSNFVAYKSILDFRNQVVFYRNYYYTPQNSLFLCGTLYSLQDVINNYMLDQPLCSFTDFGQGCGNYLITYKWQGTKTKQHIFQISDKIIQTENTIYFSQVDLEKELEDCYYTKTACDDNNAIQVVEFEKPQSNKEELLNTLNDLLTHCQNARDSIRKLTHIVGANTLNGETTTLDDDVINQDLLSEWNVSINKIQEWIYN